MFDSAKANAILKLLQGCNNFTRFRKIHAHVVVNGLDCHPSISSQLINFCAISVSGSLPYAQQLFDKMPDPPTQAWNSIIRGFSQSPSPMLALSYYNRLLSQSHSPLSRLDTFSFTFALKACERLHALPKCREIHGSILRSGYHRDTVVCTGLFRCYSRNGAVEDARHVFDDMPERDLVAWNAMISCYSQTGHHEQVMAVYGIMRDENVGLDGFSLVGLLSSCAHVGALGLGIQLHRFASDKGLFGNLFVGNALIDMYAKCGSLDDALSVFHQMTRKDVFTWNSMIHGFGVHGLGNDAISFFQQMLASGIWPNSITFLGLLCGCSHQGLVDEGVDYFHQMSSKFNLTPDIKHYGCLVDLYGRAGKLDKALDTIETSQSRDDPVLWRILLGSSKIHKNVACGEKAMKNLIRLKAVTAGDCVLLSTVYAGANYTTGVAKMRKLIKTLGIKTSPGWSWIEISNQVHKFVVDDKLHPDIKQVYQKLEEVTKRAASVGYVKDEDVILNLPGKWSEEGCSETLSSCHSEKLAIAYGLANSPQGTSLRIVKNLRVCKDCHSFTKFVSKAFDRSIIVRDRVRFHHFKDGVCSCRDYW